MIGSVEETFRNDRITYCLYPELLCLLETKNYQPLLPRLSLAW